MSAGRCRPYGACDFCGRGSTNMPRRWRWERSADGASPQRLNWKSSWRIKQRVLVWRCAAGEGPPALRERADFIPLTMIPLTDPAVGNANGRAGLSRQNQMKTGEGR